MKITLDDEADALYIQFQEGKVAKTLKLQDGILMDVDEAGRVFGIEILDVSSRIPSETLRRINIELPLKSTAL